MTEPTRVEIEVEEKKEEEETKAVSFHHTVTVSELNAPAATQDEPLKEKSPADDPNVVVVDEDTPTMEQLHSEGAEKSYQQRQLKVQAQVVRRVKRVDIETGRRCVKELTALPVWDFKDAMDPLERKKGILEGLAKNKTSFDQEEEDDESNDAQFRLESKNTDTKITRKEHPWVTRYLHWTFRASFWDVILTDFIAFFFLSWIWACCIYLGTLASPRCFMVAGTPLIEMEDWREHFYFMDAFQLSWTTFSTVGYGIVYPNVNRGSIGAKPDCFVFSFMVTLESFVGVLFAAFCGSIIFGKIARVQSIAPIEWSSPMVIRYGTGVVEPKPQIQKINEEEVDSDSDSDSDEEGESNADNNKEDAPEGTATTNTMDASVVSQKSSGNRIHKFPPPVLEFRVINSLNQQEGGEIINAGLKCFASTLASKSMESLQLTDNTNHKDVLSLLKMSLNLTQKTGREALAKTKDGISKATHVTGSVLRQSGAVASKTRGSLVQRVNRAIARPSPIATETSIGSETQPDLQPYNQQERQLQQEVVRATLAYANHQSSKHICLDEGSGLVPRRIFSHMEIETDTHPFFKRVWNIRHVLNQESPLLSAKAKRMMQKHSGKWSQDMCNVEFIRKNIHFHQIIVQLSGTHNSSGSDVSGMKVYEFSSVNIGYRFAQCMDVDEHDKLFVDTALLNDVQEQRGGGGEKIRGFLVDEFGEPVANEDDEKLLHDSGGTSTPKEEISTPINVQ